MQVCKYANESAIEHSDHPSCSWMMLSLSIILSIQPGSWYSVQYSDIVTLLVEKLSIFLSPHVHVCDF